MRYVAVVLVRTYPAVKAGLIIRGIENIITSASFTLVFTFSYHAYLQRSCV
jgi:hypothetical protein